MPASTRQASTIASVLLLWQSSLAASVLVLLPALPMLLLPGTAPRRAFSWWAGHLQSAWLSMALVILHYGLGMKIIFHSRTEQLLASLRDVGDALIVCNHRTRLDWMFLWSLAAVMGRLDNLKIVLKDSLRKAPGFGWATQCFGFAFMQRSNREADLATLRANIAVHCGRSAVSSRLAMLLFPEGTDLSESNLEKSNAHAEAQGLPKFTQVLHPRTAGFVAAWESLTTQSTKPALVDVTIAYVDHVPGERPSEKSVFLKGRCCQEVHIFAEEVASPPRSASDAQALCKSIFAEKESRLAKFYAPCMDGGHPDLQALGGVTGGALMATPLGQVPGVFGSLVGGCIYMAAVEAASLAVCWHLGLLRGVLAFLGSSATFIAVTAWTGGVDRVLLGEALPKQFRRPHKQNAD